MWDDKALARSDTSRSLLLVVARSARNSLRFLTCMKPSYLSGPHNPHRKETELLHKGWRRRIQGRGPVLLMCGSFLVLSACDDDKPYTPFQVASSLPTENSPEAESKESPSDASPEKSEVKILKGGGGSATMKAFGRTLKAPDGMGLEVVLHGLNRESDEVLGWVLPKKRGASVEQAGVWRFDTEGNPVERIQPFPDFLPNGADCQFIAEFFASGSQTITSQVESHCSSDLLAGTPVKAIAVLDPSRESPEVLHLRQSSAKSGEKVSLSVNSKDRDGDGTDDIEVNVTLTSPSGVEETLPLRWLVRTAGASREPEAPLATISKHSSALLISAVRKAEREKVPGQVDAARRLLTAVCSELGSPILFGPSGEKLTCGAILPVLSRFVEAEVKAYLGANQPGRALGAVERASWFGKGAKRDAGLTRLLEAKIPVVPAQRLARFRVTPKTSPLPYSTPLTFDELGQLWLLTDDKPKRLTMEGDPPLITPATEEQPEKIIQPPKWTIELPGPNGKTLKAVVPSCERSEVLLAFEENNAPLGAPTPLPLLAPRPGKCAGFAPEPLAATPLSWSGGALLLAVAGETFTSQAMPALPKVPSAWETSLGLAVVVDEKLSLWTGPETAGLHHCAVDATKGRVACLGKEAIVVLVKAASAGAADSKD
jgi:hypothetical protein